MNIWNMPPKTVEVTGGDPVVIELQVPPAGILRHYSVCQAGGTLNGTVTLFASQAAAQVAAGQTPDTALVGKPSSHQIASAAIVDGELLATDLEIAYRNSDSGPGYKRQKLWLVLTAPTNPPATVIEYVIATTIDTRA